jgi:hypothetical protein
MAERGKRAPAKPSAALTAARNRIAALELANSTIGDLTEKIAALKHDAEHKWQQMKVALRARIADLESRLASAEANAIASRPWARVWPSRCSRRHRRAAL